MRTERRAARFHPAVSCLVGGLLVALAPATANAATFFYQQHGPSTYRAGFSEFLTTAEGEFTAAAWQFGTAQPFVEVRFNARAIGASSRFVVLQFGPAEGGSFAPGVYENALYYPNSERPFLYLVTIDGYCIDSPARFELHELVTDAGGAIVSISLDFEQYCSYGTVVGALRFRAGDAECSGAADGDPCDDRNACTQGDSCHGDVCEGVDVVSATCSQSGECVEGGTCDPRAGACRVLERQDGTACDDGNSCTTTGACQGGQCVGTDPPDCDDQSLCTTDGCDPTVGCVHDPVAGLCLVARPVVRTVATASAGGQSARCTLRCQSSSIWTLILYDDGTYFSPGGTVTDCPTGRTVDLPAEVGKVRFASRKVARLVPTNSVELLDATAACLGVRPREYRTRIFGDRDGPPLGITSVTRLLVRDRVPVAVTSRFAWPPGARHRALGSRSASRGECGAAGMRRVTQVAVRARLRRRRFRARADLRCARHPLRARQGHRLPRYPPLRCHQSGRFGRARDHRHDHHRSCRPQRLHPLQRSPRRRADPRPRAAGVVPRQQARHDADSAAAQKAGPTELSTTSTTVGRVAAAAPQHAGLSILWKLAHLAKCERGDLNPHGFYPTGS